MLYDIKKILWSRVTGDTIIKKKDLKESKQSNCTERNKMGSSVWLMGKNNTQLQ